MKSFVLSVALLVVPAVALADSAGSGTTGHSKVSVPSIGAQRGTPPVIDPLSPDTVVLDKKGQAAVDLSRRWQDEPEMAVPGEDGRVRFLYGATLPVVVCAPLFVCDIELEAGEKVNDVQAGDTVRWKITPAKSGDDTDPTVHVIVKPQDVGLTTNLVLATNRRLYTIKLVSKRDQWMSRVAFNYPEDVQRRWAEFKEKQTEQHQATVLPSGQNLAALDFNYVIEGDKPAWRPLRVYTDGVKTYIQFPPALKTNDGPALLDLHGDDQNRIVNYRQKGTVYVVDKVLDNAVLVYGVGDDQEKVTVRHESNGGA